MSRGAPVVIAAGGTGGHVFPGLALADALVQAGDAEPTFVGTARGFESKLVPAAGYPIELFDVTAMHGGGVAQAARGGLRATLALGRALRFLRLRRPRVVVSVGGYAAGPVSLSAAVLGVPVAIVEPNSVMGLSNRLLAPLARRIYLAFEQARPVLAGAKVRLSGVPLRAGFVPRPAQASTARRVLVLGGSQGAHALNERLPEALGRVAGTHAGLAVVHQAGEGKEAAVREAYARLGLARARVVPFSAKLEDDLAWADLVVARAGAGTIAEIAAIGRASLLIPFPFAADDHQAKNAAAYADQGAAVWVRQEAADSTRIAMEVGRILDDDALRGRPATRAEALGRPEAARTIAEDLLKLDRGALMFRGRVRHVHFVGIGGIGMSGLAEILRTLEFDVSGSDLGATTSPAGSSASACVIHEGHRAEQRRRAQTSSSSRAPSSRTTPRSRRARALEIPIIPRAEMLAELMRVKYCVTIAGSHGKTTTTSLDRDGAARQAGLDPTVVVGGQVNALGSNARLGAGDLFVAEADESDGSFLKLTPTIAVVTNIDAEHLDHYGTHENVKEAFVQFTNKVPFYGLATLCVDHPHVQDILPRIARRHVTYGVSRQADYRARNVALRGPRARSSTPYRRGEAAGRVRRPDAGRSQRAQRARGHRGGRRARDPAQHHA